MRTRPICPGLQARRRRFVRFVGADLVDFNPMQDVAEVTAIVARKILKEILGKMILSAN
jgi:arginase family enzyme